MFLSIFLKNIHEDFYHSYDKDAYPDFYKELSFFSRNPTNLSERLKIDTLLSFTLFDPATEEAVVDEIIKIKKSEGYIFVYQNGREIAKILDEVKVKLPIELYDPRNSIGMASLYSHQTASDIKKNLKAKKKLEKIRNNSGKEDDDSDSEEEKDNQEPRRDRANDENEPESPRTRDRKNRASFKELFIYEEDLLKSSFQPPAFGVTVVGCSHGFDPKGSTSGYIVWINGRYRASNSNSPAVVFLRAKAFFLLHNKAFI
jgi:hypothetical protein